MHLSLPSLALLASSALAQSTHQLFNFTNYVDIENGIIRPNGNLLLTTFSDGRLFELDPLTARPEAELVASFPGATAISGIAAVGFDKYAVIGGVRGHYHYTSETIYTIDFSTRSKANETIKPVARLHDAIMLNGLAALPQQPEIVIAGDSRRGCLFRIDTTTGTTEIIFKHDLLSAPSNASSPIGINGLKAVNNHIYFTNSARDIFARIPISPGGNITGSVEVLATLNPGKEDYGWDDFSIDANGTVYVAQPPNAVARIDRDGEYRIIAGGGDSRVVLGPTSVHLAGDGKTAYVTTNGGSVDGVQYSGQVVEIEL